jgi:hypothetical protein
MAKRFADTNKYKKTFMRSLPGPYKLLWDYLYLECDHAGIWHKDFEVAQIYLGRDMIVDETKALELFNAGQERVKVNEDGTKWFLVGFAEFQYGKLNPMSKVHVGAIAAFEKFGLKPPLGDNQTLPERLPSSLKDKDKDMVKAKDKAFSQDDAFAEIWNQYPLKDGRREAERLFKSSVLNEKDQALIRKAISNYLNSRPVKNGFVKNATKWFADWQDWIEVKGENNAGSGSSSLDKLFNNPD